MITREVCLALIRCHERNLIVLRILRQFVQLPVFDLLCCTNIVLYEEQQRHQKDMGRCALKRALGHDARSCTIASQ